MNTDSGNNKPTNNAMHTSPASTIDALIQELGDAKTYKHIINILLLFKSKNPEAVLNMKAEVFLYFNYYIVPTQLGASTEFIDNMQFLQDNKYCPTAAPKFVGMPIAEDGKSCVLITKINDSIGGDLLPYYLFHANNLQKRKFADELITLLNEASIYNPALLDGSYRGWYIAPGKDNIVFDNWSTLSKCRSEEERSSIKKSILEMCDLSVKISNCYVFSNIAPELKEEIIKFFEVVYFDNSEYEGHCEFKSISTNKYYDWIHFINYNSGPERPKMGDYIRGYLLVDCVSKMAKAENNAVEELEWGPFCQVKGCLKILDISCDGGNQSALCKIPDADDYIIVDYAQVMEIEIGDYFMFSGSPCIGDGLFPDHKTIDGNKTVWNMIDDETE